MKRLAVPITALSLVLLALAGAATTTLQKHHIVAKNLPPPDLTHTTRNNSKVVEPPMGAKVVLPDGFEAATFAEGEFQQPRGMAMAGNGDVLVTDSAGRSLHVLRDSNGDGKVDERSVFATDLNRPFGVAFWQDYVYVGNTDAVVRFKYRPGQLKAEGAAEKIADLPWAKSGHWTRNIAFAPDGTKLYVAVGSESNVDVDKDPMRSAIWEFNPDGSGKRKLAGGTRNPIGLAFHPRTNRLWAAVQERDMIGEDLVPDFVTEVKDGGFYGFPYAYSGPNEDPRRKGEQPDLVRSTLVPDVLVQAHSAVLGAAFYAGNMFPKEYQGDLFVALHGSWNRSKRTGYKIIRVPFKGGNRAATGGYEDFLVGWMLSEDSPEVWGRPVGIVVARDGALLISDDGAKKIWRITYTR